MEFKVREVTLSEVLDARDRRALKQKELLGKYNCPIISFTMNIAGPVKHTPLIERAFRAGLSEIKSAISKFQISEEKISISYTGCEALFAVSAKSEELKILCVEIEEKNVLGRLFDIDVIDISGTKLERENERTCIVCKNAGKVCASRRIHTVSELQTVTNSIMQDFFLEYDCEKLSGLACDSLVYEVNVTPKPGLVDRFSNGSHSDMDINTFLASAKALKVYFYECIKAGHLMKKYSFTEIFEKLKKLGICAEADMYRVTGGVNTHKGVIYSMGIICGAIGYLWNAENCSFDEKEIFEICAKLSGDAVKRDFEETTPDSAGKKLYIEKGITGIRGEVSGGFPTVSKVSLPFFRSCLEKGLSENDAGVYTLLQLLKTLNDTNLFKRGSDEGVSFVRKRVNEILKNSSFPELSEIEKLDREFIARNLSPGGCADLIAITYYINSLKSL